jgi:hypothetical protein
MQTKVNIDHQDIYAEIRRFLLSFARCEVIQGYGNNVPMPLNGFILMRILFENQLATNINEYDIDSDSSNVTQSQELSMQLDFYGDDGSEYAHIFTTLWRDFYGCDHLTKCQPLYADAPKLLPIVNGESQYEQRWCVTAVMQYNPTVTHQQVFIDEMPVTTTNIEKV